jgi:hypothetical protein
MNKMQSLNPAVTKVWLFLLAGIMWSAVGIMLCSLAYGWLSVMDLTAALWIGGSGLVLAGIVYRFGFSRIAKRNIQRLHAFLDKVCIFAFISWKSYGLIAIMMTLGMLLRSSAIPRGYLAIVYITIGGALFISSLHYYPPVLQQMIATHSGE